jgi:hypothetical protein
LFISGDRFEKIEVFEFEFEFEFDHALLSATVSATCPATNETKEVPAAQRERAGNHLAHSKVS